MATIYSTGVVSLFVHAHAISRVFFVCICVHVSKSLMIYSI